MEILYTVTEDDYVAYNLFHYEHSPSSRRTMLITRLILPVIVVLITLISGSYRSPIAWIPPVVVAVIWFFVMPPFFKNSIKKNVRRMISEGRRVSFLGDFKLSLHDNYLRNEGDGVATESAYWRIEKIRRDQERLYVYIGSITSLIIPFRYFKDEDEVQQLVSLLEHKMANAEN